MSKGKVDIKIKNNETIFIDGKTGKTLTSQEFARRHKQSPNLGTVGRAIASKKK